jgi:hypothetical protein
MHLEDLGVNGSIILNCVFKNCLGSCGLEKIWLWIMERGGLL